MYVVVTPGRVMFFEPTRHCLFFAEVLLKHGGCCRLTRHFGHGILF